MWLVVFTALVGLAVAPGSLHPVAAFTALLCIAVGAGAAGALNMWYDADVDALMTRTARRPVPMGRVRPAKHSHSALTLGSFAVVVPRPAGELGGIRAARLHDLLLRRDLYDLAQAFDAAEYRYRRSRWSIPADDRLGGRDRIPEPRAGTFVSDYLLLDPSTLLGVGAFSHRRLCPGSHPGAARSLGRCQHAASDHALYPDPLPLGIAPWAFGYPARCTGPPQSRRRHHDDAGLQVLREIRPAERASRNLFAFSSCTCFSCLRCY